ncbi:env protein [Yellow-breasted capuchin simian foamy virus]|uniref:Envelope glycoprotein gp130 n=1 Tax=Yellow-breasted capuchin simian foamy virus TaxID=2170206 RepID=A0A0G3Y5C1_9RETR|nr:env protein [Yellow-breasted capuchin simian foamy virus]AKM21186.1 env protein [Yellow-breasted capuchin simian foamy virus]
MAPPMSLTEWILWNKKRNMTIMTSNLTGITPDQKKALLDEIDEEELFIKPTIQQRLSYTCYLACATTTRIMIWILFCVIVLAVALITCFTTAARIQWRHAIITPGPVIDWNSTIHEIIPAQQRTRRFARDLIRVTEEKYVEVNATGIPQGIILLPHPKPIIQKNRVLGLSQILLINSESLASIFNIKQEHKSVLTEIIQEEMRNLQDVTLNFDLPIGDPKTQHEYVQSRCFQEFKDCYLVKYQENNKPWPTDDVIADMCPLPGGESLPQNAWDYYLEISNIRPQNWTSATYFGQARMGGFWVPPKLKQQNFTHVLFCSDQLYGQWYNLSNSKETNERLLMNKLDKLLNNTNKLRNRALPVDWNTQGQNRLFRNLSRLDYCKLPEAVVLLNSTKYDYSLWEGDCGIYRNNVTEHPSCKNFNYSTKFKVHPYTCRHWRFIEGEEKTDCFTADKTNCLYYSYYSSPSYLWDFGWLAYNNHFPSPICVKETKIREAKYEVYSLYGECMQATKAYTIDQVLVGLHGFLNFQKTPVQDMPKERAFIGLDNPKWPPYYPNMTIEQKIKCKDRNKRNRRDTNNWQKLQKAGYAITNAVTQIAKITDLNNEAIVSGIYLLRNHIVTLMEATLHDVSALGDAVTIQHFHTHLAQFKLLLIENRVDWNYISSKWIQEQLNLDDADMKILRRTAKALVYNVEELDSRPTSTTWEIALYYEIIIPGQVYSTNWEVHNIGHLVDSAGSLTLVTVQHPYTIVNQECGETKYLHIEECTEQDYIICEQVTEVLPCGNQTNSDCPVLAKTVNPGYVHIEPLKNGSYIYMAHYQDCGIKPYVPQIVTVNATVKCLGHEIQPPLQFEETASSLTPQVPSLKLRLPHLVGVIVKLKNIQIQVTSTWESIKDQVERSQTELLRLDIHEGDTPAWIRQLAESTKDIWPAAANIFGKVGEFLSGALGGLFGTLGYIKPIILGIVILLLIVVVVKIISWLPSKKKQN